jgi:hypothetical protein
MGRYGSGGTGRETIMTLSEWLVLGFKSFALSVVLLSASMLIAFALTS